jgi:prepilin peptidase CpaA
MIKDLLLLTIFPGAMALAAATDFFTMTVPNRIALVLVAGFLVAAPLVSLGWPEIGLHFGLAVAALVVTFTLFSFGWIGGGDAKLFAATCLWVGPAALLSYSVFSALIGGALTLALLFWRGVPLPEMLISQNWLVRLHDPKECVPYGIADCSSIRKPPSWPHSAADLFLSSCAS